MAPQSHQFRALICSAVCSGGVGKGSNPNTEPSSAGSSQRAMAPMAPMAPTQQTSEIGTA